MGGQIWLKCITVDMIMMIRYKNNIFERVEKNHADLAWNYPSFVWICFLKWSSLNCLDWIWMVLLKFRLTCLTLHRPVSVSIEILDYYLEHNFSLSRFLAWLLILTDFIPSCGVFSPQWIHRSVNYGSYLLFVLGRNPIFSTWSQVLLKKSMYRPC